MNWKEAVEEAREELGYYPNQYVDDWYRLMDKAREIFEYATEEEYIEFCDDAYYNHQIYLKSDSWKLLRKKILQRDFFKCCDCEEQATEVHHIEYDYLGTDKEESYCVSLCNICHKKRHDITQKEIVNYNSHIKAAMALK
jgi:hypothetical protein